MPMNYWLLPQIPGFSKLMFGVCVLILAIGLASYVYERRKEIEKAKRQVS